MTGILSSVWDLVWLFFTVFIFFAWLMVLFSIIGDLFRDRELSGLMKALWIIALVFVPFITALIYIIVRGNGMTKRAVAQVEAQQSAAHQYIRSVASSSPVQELVQAKALLDSGAITAAEFDILKSKALA